MTNILINQRSRIQQLTEQANGDRDYERENGHIQNRQAHALNPVQHYVNERNQVD